MSSERTNKKRLDDIEGQLDVVKEELGEVKDQVTNHIPSALKALKKDNEGLFTLVNENAKINSNTLNTAMKIVKVLIPYTSLRGTKQDTE